MYNLITNIENPLDIEKGKMIHLDKENRYAYQIENEINDVCLQGRKEIEEAIYQRMSGNLMF